MITPHLRTAMPEWLSRSDRNPRAWSVDRGPLGRGEAYTDLSRCVMRIPVGADETSRCVRAHEMMHAKVSPESLWRPDGLEHLEDDTLVAAEEFRVNQLIKAVGFPVDRHLADGSETRSGERIGANGDWNQAVLMIAATSGTKACRHVFTGLRRTRPDWVERLRSFDRRLKKAWLRMTAQEIAPVASSSPWGDATVGWRATLDIAEIIHGELAVSAVDSPDSRFETDTLLGSRGSFARPIVADLPLTRHVGGRTHSIRTPSPTGRHPRRLDRLLTDPDRRIFDRKTRCPGGVILVDQSGSMRLGDDDVWDMIRAAPGCTVIGYSHEARSTTTPNIWILARNGRVVDKVPRGNGGNGVDGPALRFAASLRQRNQPIIWVCDGYVTDALDDHCDQLTRECADLVTRHRIHMVSDVEGAIVALSRAARGIRIGAHAIGPVSTSDAKMHLEGAR